MKRITVSRLKRAHACWVHLERFARHFPKGVPVTLTTAKRLRDLGFPVTFGENLLPYKSWRRYRRRSKKLFERYRKRLWLEAKSRRYGIVQAEFENERLAILVQYLRRAR